MRVFIHIFDLCTLTRKFIAHRRFDGSFVFVECDYLFAFFCADIISHDDIHDIEIFLVFERLYEWRRIFIVRAFIKLRTDYHNRICKAQSPKCRWANLWNLQASRQATRSSAPRSKTSNSKTSSQVWRSESRWVSSSIWKRHADTQNNPQRKRQRNRKAERQKVATLKTIFQRENQRNRNKKYTVNSVYFFVNSFACLSLFSIFANSFFLCR